MGKAGAQWKVIGVEAEGPNAGAGANWDPDKGMVLSSTHTLFFEIIDPIHEFLRFLGYLFHLLVFER